jgi:hypothetical protein
MRSDFVRLTSGQIWGFWGTSFARNAGGVDPVSKVALGMDAFGSGDAEGRQEGAIKWGEHRNSPPLWVGP